MQAADRHDLLPGRKRSMTGVNAVSQALTFSIDLLELGMTDLDVFRHDLQLYEQE